LAKTPKPASLRPQRIWSAGLPTRSSPASRSASDKPAAAVTFEPAAAGDSRAPGKSARFLGAPGTTPARPLEAEAPQNPEKHHARPSAKPPPEVKPESQKTFSDAEILASVKPEPHRPSEAKLAGKSTPLWKRREHSEAKTVHPPKKSRLPAGDFTRLHMNLGEKMGVVPIDIVNAIAGETGLPGKVVGNVDIRERHLFVDVATEHVETVVAKLAGIRVKNQSLKPAVVPPAGS